MQNLIETVERIFSNSGNPMSNNCLDIFHKFLNKEITFNELKKQCLAMLDSHLDDSYYNKIHKKDVEIYVAREKLENAKGKEAKEQLNEYINGLIRERNNLEILNKDQAYWTEEIKKLEV